MSKAKNESAKIFPFGVLNDVNKPLIEPLMDNKRHSLWDITAATARETFRPKGLEGTGPYIGQVLRVDVGAGERTANKGKPTRQGFDPITKLFRALAGLMPERTEEAVQTHLVKIRVRIPEIHAMYPDPSQYGDIRAAEGNHQQIIEMYPTFIAQSNRVEEPKVGSLVWVDFKNKTEFRDGIYIKPIAEVATAGAALTSPQIGLCTQGSLQTVPTPTATWSQVPENLRHTGLPNLNVTKNEKVVLFGDSQCSGHLGKATQAWFKSKGWKTYRHGKAGSGHRHWLPSTKNRDWTKSKLGHQWSKIHLQLKDPTTRLVWINLGGNDSLSFSKGKGLEKVKELCQAVKAAAPKATILFNGVVPAGVRPASLSHKWACCRKYTPPAGSGIKPGNKYRDDPKYIPYAKSRQIVTKNMFEQLKDEKYVVLLNLAQVHSLVGPGMIPGHPIGDGIHCGKAAAEAYTRTLETIFQARGAGQTVMPGSAEKAVPGVDQIVTKPAEGIASPAADTTAATLKAKVKEHKEQIAGYKTENDPLRDIVRRANMYLLKRKEFLSQATPDKSLADSDVHAGALQLMGGTATPTDKQYKDAQHYLKEREPTVLKLKSQLKQYEEQLKSLGVAKVPETTIETTPIPAPPAPVDPVSILAAALGSLACGPGSATGGGVGGIAGAAAVAYPNAASRALVPVVEDAIEKAAVWAAPGLGMSAPDVAGMLRVKCLIESGGYINSMGKNGYSGLWAHGYPSWVSGGPGSKAQNKVRAVKDLEHWLNPHNQAMMTVKMMMGSKRILLAMGYEVNGAHLYMLHQQGPAGGPNFMKRAKAGQPWGDPLGTSASPGWSKGWSDWRNAYSNYGQTAVSTGVEGVKYRCHGGCRSKRSKLPATGTGCQGINGITAAEGKRNGQMSKYCTPAVFYNKWMGLWNYFSRKVDRYSSKGQVKGGFLLRSHLYGNHTGNVQGWTNKGKHFPDLASMEVQPIIITKEYIKALPDGWRQPGLKL